MAVQLRTKLFRMIHTAWTIISVKGQASLQIIYEQATLRQANKMVCNLSHVLYTEYELLSSGRRFRVSRCRLNRFKNFIPVSIKLLNSGRMDL